MNDMTILGMIFASTGFWGVIQLLITTKSKKKVDIEGELKEVNLQIKALRDETQLLKEAMRVILHDRMLRAWEMAKKRKQRHIKASVYEFDNLKDVHKMYNAFQGNDTGDRIFEEICKELNIAESEEKI